MRHRDHGGHGGHGGHDHDEGHSPEMFREKFWLWFVLTLPVVFWSAHIRELLGYEAPTFPGRTGSCLHWPLRTSGSPSALERRSPSR